MFVYLGILCSVWTTACCNLHTCMCVTRPAGRPFVDSWGFLGFQQLADHSELSVAKKCRKKMMQDFLLIYFYIHPLFFHVVLFLVFLTNCFVACILLIEICNISRYIFVFFVTVVVRALYGQKYCATCTVHLQEVLSHGNLCHEAPGAQFLRWC